MTFVVDCDVYPETDSERKALAYQWLPRLTKEWLDQGLPAPEVFHVLVHRPGEIASSPERATHIGDEADARAEETGLVAVAISLTDVVKGAEEFEVWRIRQTGPAL